MSASTTGASDRSATAQAYDHLKQSILTNRLSPGAELREGVLAETTGFGRTPVRDALRRLVHEGFVEVRPRQGYRVSAVSIASVRDLFEMRLLLEPAAVGLAAERATEEELAALHPLAHETYDPEVSGSYEQFLRDNRDFHVRIARAAGNERLAMTLQVLLEEMQRLFVIGVRGAELATEVMHEHHDLHDALLARDAQRARAIVVSQIEASRERILEGLVQTSSRPGRAAAGVVLAGR